MKATPRLRAVLADYRPHYRVMDTVAVGAFGVLAAWSGARLVAHPEAGAWFIAIALLCGWVATDLLSGLVHWAFDTWGRCTRRSSASDSSVHSASTTGTRGP